MSSRGIWIAMVVCMSAVPALAQSITMTPNPVDVGDVLVGQTDSATGSLSSNQNVNVDLVLTNTCNGAGTGTFALSPTNGLKLNNPKTITVSYTPSGSGQRTCLVLVLKENSSTQYGFFYVRGNGQTPQQMSLSTNSQDFGDVRWSPSGRTSSRTITVSNTGDLPLSISNVSISGDYSIGSGGTSATINGKSSRQWTIIFDPSAAGTRNGTLTFTSNSNTNGSQSVNLTGVGTNGVIDMPAGSDADFGTIPTGSSGQGDIDVVNSAGSPAGPLSLMSASISGGSWFTFAGCGGGTSCTFSPTVSVASGSPAVIGVRCSPPSDAIDGTTQTATVTVSSDTDPGTVDNTAALTCTAGKSNLQTSMSNVPFGPQLVGTASPPLMISVMNTGSLMASFYLQKNGAGAGAFALETPNNCGLSGATGNQCTVPAGMSMSFIVTFTPQSEGDISAGVALTVPAGASPQVVVAGRGVDRHIATVDSMQAPDTYRNPGDSATEVLLDVQNTGEYPLEITGVQITQEGIWSLKDPFVPFAVPGLDKKSIVVLFAPDAAGKAPDTQVVITSDDPRKPTSTVVLSGNGKDRNVSMLPGAIDFGNTGAGIPLALSTIRASDQLLTILNMDEVPFKVKGFEYRSAEGDVSDVYRVQSLGGEAISEMELPIGEERKLDIVFAPPSVGEFRGELTLLIDADRTRTVEVRGTALFVDAHGGGGFGCSTGGGAGGGVLLALLALRRRRQRA